MATARPFAYNPGSAIAGTEQIGNLEVGTPSAGFTSSPQFWNGPNEDLGYLMLGASVTTYSSGTQTITNFNGVTQSSSDEPF